MVRLTRTARIAHGNRPKPIQWAKDLREYIRTKFKGGVDVKIFLETLGEYGVICWMTDFKNLAVLEVAGKVLDSDPEYQELLQTSAELFMPGTVDKVY